MTAQDKELVVSYLTLRQMIGWVAILMPAAIRIGAFHFEHIHSTKAPEVAIRKAPMNIGL